MEKIRPIEHVFLIDNIKTEIEELPEVDIGILNRYVIYKDKEERVNTHRLYLVNLTSITRFIPIHPVKNVLGEETSIELRGYPEFTNMIYDKYPDLKERDLVHSVAFPGLIYNIAPYGKRYNQLPECKLIDNILYAIQNKDEDFENTYIKEYVRDNDCEVLIYILIDNEDIFRFLSHNPYYRERLAYITITTLDKARITINE